MKKGGGTKNGEGSCQRPPNCGVERVFFLDEKNAER